MKQYTGTKTINAKPMNRQDYNDLRGWQLPDDENGADEGYLVEYPDSDSNLDGFDGYVSWSPKAQFEGAYKLSGTFLDRMVIERDDLQTKLNGARAALENRPAGMDDIAYNGLVDQVWAMEDYLSAVSYRIGLAEEAA